MIGPEWSAEVEPVTHRNRRRLDELSPAADLAARLGAAPTFDAPYWIQAPLWRALCRTLVCGPSGGGLHSIREWGDLGRVRSSTRALVEVLASAD